jgi:hypothetical protein
MLRPSQQARRNLFFSFLMYSLRERREVLKTRHVQMIGLIL